MMDPWSDMTLGLSMPGDDIGLDWFTMHNLSRSMSSNSAGTSSSLQGTPPAANAFTFGVTKNCGPGRKFPCKMCAHLCDSKADLQLHSQTHTHELKPYRCSRCPKCFANASYLSQHMRIHLGIKPYFCDICKRKFTQLSHLQQHLRTHTGDKPYKCYFPACQKAFSQLSNLQSHSRIHEADKPYRCHSCYKCFYDEQALREHIPRHKDSKHSKTHLCAFCGKAYTQSLYLATHIATKHCDKMEQTVAAMRNAVYYPPKGDNNYYPGTNSNCGNQENIYHPSYSPFTGLTNQCFGGQYNSNATNQNNDWNDMWNPWNSGPWTRPNVSAFSAFCAAGY